MLYIILYLSLFIGLITYLIYGFYSYYKFRKTERKEWEDFIKSLIPGSEWKLQKGISLNPFDEPSLDTIVIIVETRKNCYEKTWVRYRFKDKKYLHEIPASDFEKLYSKVN
jgi:hypothetical protein